MHAKHGHYDPKVCFTSYIDLLPLFSYFDSVYFARSSQASKEFAARKSLSSLSLEREPFSFGCPRPAVVLLSACESHFLLGMWFYANWADFSNYSFVDTLPRYACNFFFIFRKRALFLWLSATCCSSFECFNYSFVDTLPSDQQTYANS